MQCPLCKVQELKPALIEEQLPALGCPQCKGSLVSLLYYRHWAETYRSEANEPPHIDTAAVQASDTSAALHCPKCTRFMTKFKVAGSVANRLDVCPACHEAWLDCGEWELLEALQLSHRVPSILTDKWQRQIRHELTEETRRNVLKRSLGDEAAERVEAFREWLTTQAKKPEILTYLYRD